MNNNTDKKLDALFQSFEQYQQVSEVGGAGHDYYKGYVGEPPSLEERVASRTRGDSEKGMVEGGQTEQEEAAVQRDAEASFQSRTGDVDTLDLVRKKLQVRAVSYEC